MDSFLQVFGNFTIKEAAAVIAAIVFLGICGKKVKTNLANYFRNEQEKSDRINAVIALSEQYPKWRQQSIDVQEKLTGEISGIKNEQKRILDKLDEIEASSRKRERNKLREQLLQSYRYYTSKEKNPMQAWSEMEADTFWKSFGDYEDVDGNGHIHTEVQPAMRLLEVIPMHETEKIAELMHSRR